MALPDPQVFTTLPVSERVQRQVARLALALYEALGDDLRSLCLYGSVARGEWNESTSDVNLLVETAGIDFERIDALAGAVSEARKRGRIETLLLTGDEIRRGADAFAVLVEGVRRNHILIYGSTDLLRVTASPAQLRLAAEHELRTVHMRIRRTFLGYCSHTSLVDKIRIYRDFTRAMASLRALCALEGRAVPSGTPEAIAQIGEVLDRDVAVLEELHTTSRSRQYSQAQLAALHQAFSDLLNDAIERVDGLGAALGGEPRGVYIEPPRDR